MNPAPITSPQKCPEAVRYLVARAVTNPLELAVFSAGWSQCNPRSRNHRRHDTLWMDAVSLLYIVYNIEFDCKCI